MVKLGPVQTADHPLSNKKKSNNRVVVSSNSTPFDPLTGGVDPLRGSGSVAFDPLSAKIESQQSLIISGQLNRQIGSRQKVGYLNWAFKKQKYLKKYTTDKNIPVISVS